MANNGLTTPPFPPNPLMNSFFSSTFPELLICAFCLVVKRLALMLTDSQRSFEELRKRLVNQTF